MAFSITFSMALCLLSSSLSLVLESWEYLEARLRLEGPGSVEALPEVPHLVWRPEEVEAMAQI